MAVRHTAKLALTVVAALCLSAGAYAETLKQAVEETVDSNPDVLIAAKSRLASTESYKQARAGYLPTVDLSAGYGRERSKNPTVAGRLGKNDYDTLTRKESGVFVNQLLFDGMGTPSEVARRRADSRATAFEVAAVAQDLGLEAARSYMLVLRNQELVALAKANVSAHRRTSKMIKERSDSGLNREADADQATGRLALAKANLEARESDYRDAKIEYLRVVGRAPSGLKYSHIPRLSVPNGQEEVVSYAMTHHPRLHQAKFDVNEAEAAYNVSRSLFWPRVDAQFGGDWNRNMGGSKGTDNAYFAMLRMEYNVFNGGADVARVKESRYLLQRAQERYNASARSVDESARQSWNDYRTSTLRIKQLRQHQESSKKTVMAYRKQFKLGKRSLLDLLDSENEMFDASSAHTIEKYDELVARYRILNSMGVLLQSLDVPLPMEAHDEFAHPHMGSHVDIMRPGMKGGKHNSYMDDSVYSENDAPARQVYAEAASPASSATTHTIVAANKAPVWKTFDNPQIASQPANVRYASATANNTRRITPNQLARIKQKQQASAQQFAQANQAKRTVNVASNGEMHAWSRPQRDAIQSAGNTARPAAVATAQQPMRTITTAQASRTTPTNNWARPGDRGVAQAFQQAQQQQGAWNVQIGTFGQADNAKRLVSKLRDTGYNAFIRTTAHNGRQLSHVMVQPTEANKSGAQRTLAELEDGFNLRGMVTNRA